MNLRISRSLVGAVLVASLGLATPALAAKNTSGVALPAEPKFPKGNAKAYGLALANYLDAINKGWVDQYTKSTMTLYDSRGDKVVRQTRQLFLEGKDGNKSISRFMSPAEIRGVAALTHEHPQATDDTWLYLPASRRIRRISGANRTASFQGTEFSYEDLSTMEPERYHWKFLNNADITTNAGKFKVYQLEAIPAQKDTGYKRLVLNVNRDHWRVERIDFQDLSGRKLKTLNFRKHKLLHGRYWRALHMDMKNHQTQKRTTIHMKSLFLNLSLYKKKDGSARSNLKDAQFTRRALEGG